MPSFSVLGITHSEESIKDLNDYISISSGHQVLSDFIAVAIHQYNLHHQGQGDNNLVVYDNFHEVVKLLYKGDATENKRFKELTGIESQNLIDSIVRDLKTLALGGEIANFHTVSNSEPLLKGVISQCKQLENNNAESLVYCTKEFVTFADKILENLKNAPSPNNLGKEAEKKK